MKKLCDGTMVLSRTYYYLLDWNEQDNKEFIITSFDKTRLCDLTHDEYKRLFFHATSIDSQNGLIK